MAKPTVKKKYESKSGTFSPSRRPPRGLSEKADRSSDGFRGRKDKSSEYSTPPGRTSRDRDLPEKADRSSDGFRPRREGRSFPSFDRPRKEPGFVSTDKKPMIPEQSRTVSAAALKNGFEKAKDEIMDMCDELSAIMGSRYNIGEVQLTVSFNSGGEFIGFGASGAASIRITIIPSK